MNLYVTVALGAFSLGLCGGAAIMYLVCNDTQGDDNESSRR